MRPREPDPDFLVRLKNGATLVLEVKGQDRPQNQTKRRFLAEWVEAVNGHGGFGRWVWGVSYRPSDVTALLAALPNEHASEPECSPSVVDRLATSS